MTAGLYHVEQREDPADFANRSTGLSSVGFTTLEQALLAQHFLLPYFTTQILNTLLSRDRCASSACTQKLSSGEMVKGPG